MQQLHFAITGVHKPEYEMFMAAYNPALRPAVQEGGVMVFLRSGIIRASQFIRGLNGGVGEKVMGTSVERTAYHPIVDPAFLVFAISTATYLRGGYQIGRGNARAGYRMFRPGKLLGAVDSRTYVMEGLRVEIEPHHYDIAIPDVPTYQQLKRLQRLTRDKTLGDLLNRLAFWLSLLSYAHYYAGPLVAINAPQNELVFLESSFFSSFRGQL